MDKARQEAIQQARRDTEIKLEEALKAEDFGFLLPVTFAIDRATRQFIDRAEELLRVHKGMASYVEALNDLALSIGNSFYRRFAKEIRWSNPGKRAAAEAVEKHVAPVLADLVNEYASKFALRISLPAQAEPSDSPYSHRAVAVAVNLTDVQPLDMATVSPSRDHTKRAQQSAADCEARSKARGRWLDQQLSKKNGWSSDSDIASEGGPTYNTIRRYRAGRKTNRDLYVRKLLAKAFGCDVTDVPK